MVWNFDLTMFMLLRINFQNSVTDSTESPGYQNIYLINLSFELERCTHPCPKTNSY